MESKKLSLLNKLSFGTLLGSIFLSIFAFIPYSFIPINAAKGFIVCIGVLLSLFFWLLARLVDGKFVIPKDRLLILALLIPLSFLISSFFSYSPYMSLFGVSFEVGTFGTMLAVFLTLFLSSIYFQNENKVKLFFKLVWVGATVVALFEFIHIFFNVEKLAPGLLKGLIFPNLFGSWNEFALFFGFIVIFSLVTLQLQKLSKLKKIFIYAMILVSLFFLSLVNSWLVWMLTGIFSLIVFVYGISFAHREDVNTSEKSVPMGPFLVILVSLLFILAHDSLGAIIPNYFGLFNTDITPSLSSTLSVAYKALAHNPFFGIGPNTFSIGWSMWRPTEILASQFSGTDFYFGVGMVPTFLVTTGIIGFLSILMFLVVFFFRALQSIKVALRDNNSNYLIFSSIIVAFYFWAATIFSSPNIVCLVLAALSTGVFIGILAYKRVISIYEGSFLNDPRASFFSILTIVVLMIVSIATSYMYVSKFTALVYFAKSQNATQKVESLIESENNLSKAISFDKNDLYYRALSQVYLSHIITILSDKSVTPEFIKSQAQDIVSLAEKTASLAINNNPKFYKNWVNLGDIYNTYLALGIEGAYSNALSSYNKALELSPNNPNIIFSIGTLNYKKADYNQAVKDFEKAVSINSTYFDARYLLALSYQKVGENTKAREQLNLLDSVFPNNKIIKDALASISSGGNIAPLPDQKGLDKTKKIPATIKKP